MGHYKVEIGHCRGLGGGGVKNVLQYGYVIYEWSLSSGHGRNGAQNPLKPQQDNIEHWPMKTFPTTAISNNTR